MEGIGPIYSSYCIIGCHNSPVPKRQLFLRFHSIVTACFLWQPPIKAATIEYQRNRPLLGSIAN